MTEAFIDGGYEEAGFEGHSISKAIINRYSWARLTEKDLHVAFKNLNQSCVLDEALMEYLSGGELYGQFLVDRLKPVGVEMDIDVETERRIRRHHMEHLLLKPGFYAEMITDHSLASVEEQRFRYDLLEYLVGRGEAIDIFSFRSLAWHKDDRTLSLRFSDSSRAGNKEVDYLLTPEIGRLLNNYPNLLRRLADLHIRTQQEQFWNHIDSALTYQGSIKLAELAATKFIDLSSGLETPIEISQLTEIIRSDYKVTPQQLGYLQGAENGASFKRLTMDYGKAEPQAVIVYIQEQGGKKQLVTGRLQTSTRAVTAVELLRSTGNMEARKVWNLLSEMKPLRKVGAEWVSRVGRNVLWDCVDNAVDLTELLELVSIGDCQFWHRLELDDVWERSLGRTTGTAENLVDSPFSEFIDNMDDTWFEGN